MFVESMMFEEIRKEFEKDRKSLLMKVVMHSQHVRRLMRKTKATVLKKSYEWISPNKNRWVYNFDIDYKVAKDNFHILIYCLFYTERSYAVLLYSTSTDRLTYFTSHFFTRYFERAELQTHDIHETFRIFIANNPHMVTHSLTHLFDNKYDAFIQMKTGAGFGTFHRKINLVELRTFITNDMLKGKQIELSRSLDQQFNLGIVRKKEEEK
jgi:hypothetical protein